MINKLNLLISFAWNLIVNYHKNKKHTQTVKLGALRPSIIHPPKNLTSFLKVSLQEKQLCRDYKVMTKSNSSSTMLLKWRMMFIQFPTFRSMWWFSVSGDIMSSLLQVTASSTNLIKLLLAHWNKSFISPLWYRGLTGIHICHEAVDRLMMDSN